MDKIEQQVKALLAIEKTVVSRVMAKVKQAEGELTEFNEAMTLEWIYTWFEKLKLVELVLNEKASVQVSHDGMDVYAKPLPTTEVGDIPSYLTPPPEIDIYHGEGWDHVFEDILEPKWN